MGKVELVGKLRILENDKHLKIMTNVREDIEKRETVREWIRQKELWKRGITALTITTNWMFFGSQETSFNSQLDNMWLKRLFSLSIISKFKW